jgi:hypothetical protein
LPIQHRVDRKYGVVLAWGEGVVSDDELLAFVQRTANDSEFRSGMHELIDLRRVDTSALSTRSLRRTAELFAAFDTGPAQGRVAIVAPEDLAYGLSRMYQAFRGEDAVELMVFRDMIDARKWLGLPEDEDTI